MYFLLSGLQSTPRPPNRNRELSDIAVSVCHDLPAGAGVGETLERIFTKVNLSTEGNGHSCFPHQCLTSGQTVVKQSRGVAIQF